MRIGIEMKKGRNRNDFPKQTQNIHILLQGYYFRGVIHCLFGANFGIKKSFSCEEITNTRFD